MSTSVVRSLHSESLAHAIGIAVLSATIPDSPQASPLHLWLSLSGITMTILIMCLISLYQEGKRLTSAAKDIYQSACCYNGALLVPLADDPDIVHLRVEMTPCDTVIITQVYWSTSNTISETVRQYELFPCGKMVRRVVGHRMGTADGHWYSRPPREHLDYLQNAMSTSYSQL